MTPADLDAAAAVFLSWLLTYAIHSTILLAAAAVAAWRFADQHAWLDPIWKTALVAPLVTASLPLASMTLPFDGAWAMPGGRAVTRPAVAAPTPSGPPDGEPHVVGTAIVEHAMPSRAGERSAESAPSLRPSEAGFTAWQAMARWWPSMAATTWLIVAMVSVVRYGVRLRSVYRRLGSGVAVSATALLATIERLRSRASRRRPIGLTTSAMCPVPVALGGGRIVLPARFLQELEPEQQHAALAHEVWHVARRDPEWRILIEILERALFFQPLIRLARARLSDSAEFLCDEWAVGQTQSPLALARCLSVVASWWSAADKLPAGVTAMARSESAIVRRVTRILDAPVRVARRPRLHWLAIPVALVAVAAPRVTATHRTVPEAATPAVAAVLGVANSGSAPEPHDPQRAPTAAGGAASQAPLRLDRFDRPGASLEERWRQALADAARQRVTDFWIVYTFDTPTHADDLMMSDTADGSFVSSNGRISTRGPSLTALFNPSAVPLEGGNVAVLLRYRGAGADAIDRASYRSVQLGFDFGRTPVFWLGEASESQSFERVKTLFDRARDRKIQVFLIELASLHANSDDVVPFLTRLVDASWPAEIRREAAEGFDHHHDPRSIEVLLRVARTDSDSSVRAEAAETIGEVQTPESIPALTALVSESTDPEVRREAAEGFAGQPAERAVVAIERVIATSGYPDVLSEAIEALGELGDPAAFALLVQTANTHPDRRAQQEAVETLGEIDAPGVVDALTHIAWEHQDVTIQREAVETLGDRRDDAAALAALERIAREHDREDVQVEAIDAIGEAGESSLHPLILELALSGRSTRIRREALDSIGEAVAKIDDQQLLDRAQAVVERAVYDDPDPAVRVHALDALNEMPDERALRALRDVIARHPDARVRREAADYVRERQ